MKIKRLIWGIGIIVLILMFLEILRNNNKMPEKDDVLEHLNQIYASENDQFTCVNYGSSSGPIPGPIDQYYFKSEKYSVTNQDFFIVKIQKVNDKYEFEDNYYEMYMYKEAKSYFKNIASNLNDYAVEIRFGVNYLKEYLTFEEYRSEATMDIFYITNKEVSEQERQELVEKISNEIDYGTVSFWVTTDKLLRYGNLDTILNYTDNYIDYDKTTEYYIRGNGEIIQYK